MRGHKHAIAVAALTGALSLVVAAVPDERTRVLVVEPTGKALSAEDRHTFAGLIAASLARWPMFDVVTTADLKKAMQLNAERQLLGCATDACLSDLAELTSAKLVVFGDVNRLGKLLVFNLNLFDSAASKSAGRVSVEAQSVEQLPSRLRLKMDELVGSAIRAFRSQGGAAEKCPDSMVRIPGGQFYMGADDDDKDPLLKDAKPSHNVTLLPYCIDRFEVTVADYKRCSDAGKCRRPAKTVDWPGIKPDQAERYSPLCHGSDGSKARHPINCVDWKMAARYCESVGGRLPTEAEWEFATRGPDGRRYPWGDDKPTSSDLNACGAECAAWSKAQGLTVKTLYPDDDGYVNTAPVGSFPAGASRFGPEDVVGNVWEWVSDRYAPYTAADVVNPIGPPKGDKRVLRGGAFNGGVETWLRPAFRFSAPERQRSHAIGFRCARSLDGSDG